MDWIVDPMPYDLEAPLLDRGAAFLYNAFNEQYRGYGRTR